MISGTFDITPIVPIRIDTFLIDENIENSENVYKSEQKNHNLAIRQQGIIRKSARGAIAQKIFVALFAVNNIYKRIRSIDF